MPVTLTISAESVEEFDTFLARFARSGAVAASAIMPEIAHTPAAQEAAAAADYPARPGWYLRARNPRCTAGRQRY